MTSSPWRRKPPGLTGGSGRACGQPGPAAGGGRATADVSPPRAAEGTPAPRGPAHDLARVLDTWCLTGVHRSTIVNRDRVEMVRPHLNGEFFLVRDSGHGLKLSRSYKGKLRLLRS